MTTTPHHPLNQIADNLSYLKVCGHGDSPLAEELRDELLDVFIHECGEIEHAARTGYWYYNDQPYIEGEFEEFCLYWTDILSI
jgi:hypothetical protein